ncbi:MAG: FumA C-terminus/TtdB family hydratase beta subunit [Acutalibacteraceae bacterium]|nr:FumA C-terminus/TtdB family hydratase beta subunit [Acutalibacteraceae bacterium]
MKEYTVNTSELKELCPVLNAGDRVILSGTVYTSRDAAHKRIFEHLEQGNPLPYDLNGAVIYYAGPTPTPENAAIGSCGPTTSKRMDPYTPKLLDLGLTATIGKGERSKEVCEAIKRNKSVYLCAIGGAGALASLSIKKCEVIAFDDLGCESVKRLEFNNFPLIVGIDCKGGNIFER